MCLFLIVLFNTLIEQFLMQQHDCDLIQILDQSTSNSSKDMNHTLLNGENVLFFLFTWYMFCNNAQLDCQKFKNNDAFNSMSTYLFTKDFNSVTSTKTQTKKTSIDGKSLDIDITGCIKWLKYTNKIVYKYQNHIWCKLFVYTWYCFDVYILVFLYLNC